MLIKKIDLSLKSDRSEIRKLADFFDELASHSDIQRKILNHLNLAIDELITNTIFYGYKDQPDKNIEVRVLRRGDSLEVELTDEAAPFDPLAAPEPDLESALDDRPIGGLGIHFVRTLIDQVSYRREGRQNIVTLTMKLGSSQNVNHGGL